MQDIVGLLFARFIQQKNVFTYLIDENTGFLYRSTCPAFPKIASVEYYTGRFFCFITVRQVVRQLAQLRRFQPSQPLQEVSNSHAGGRGNRP